MRTIRFARCHRPEGEAACAETFRALDCRPAVEADDVAPAFGQPGWTSANATGFALGDCVFFANMAGMVKVFRRLTASENLHQPSHLWLFIASP
jgi:hypothetical protein